MNETPSARHLPSLLVLAACLIIPSSGTVARYAGVPGFLVYAVGVCAVLFAVERWGRPWMLDHVTERQALWFAVALLAAAAVAVAVLYPVANSGTLGAGSDRDDALNVGVRALLGGRYPYAERTYLDNPISPMPGAFLLAAPFVVLFGSSAYQNLFWLAIFYLDVRRGFVKDARAALLLMLILVGLAPAVWQELVTGGDLLANALYVFAFAAFMLSAHGEDRSRAWPRIAADILLGIGLASRANYLLILLPLAPVLASRRGWTHTLRHLLLTVAVLALLVAPFYLYDPVAFWPAHTTVEVNRFDVLIPHAGAILVALTVLTACLAVFHRNHHDPVHFLYDCALPQAVPVVLGLAAYLYVHNLANGYTSFGLNFMFFGAVATYLRTFHPTDASLS